MFPGSNMPRETVAPARATPEKLFCPLSPVFAIVRVVSADTPRECQTRGRGSHQPLMTDHQDGERERQSKQPQGLRASYPRRSVTVHAVYKEGATRRLYPVSAS